MATGEYNAANPSGGGGKNEYFWPFGAIFGPFWPEIKNFFIFLEKNKKNNEKTGFS